VLNASSPPVFMSIMSENSRHTSSVWVLAWITPLLVCQALTRGSRYHSARRLSQTIGPPQV